VLKITDGIWKWWGGGSLNEKELKIAILFFEDRIITTYPSITNTIKILSQKGHRIKVFVPPIMSPFPSIVNAEFIPSGNGDVKSYVGSVSKNLLGSDLIFAFSIEGLFIATRIYRVFSKKNVPVIYFSMELIYKNYFSETIKKIGFRTGFFTITRLFLYLKLMFFGKNFVKIGVAQDEKRCELLKKEFPFIKKTFVVPNSYIGFNGDIPKINIRAKFNVPENKKILLFSGGLNREFGNVLNKILSGINNEYVFFLNIYSRDNYVNEIKRGFKDFINRGVLVVNDDILEEFDYLELVKSSHIGIIWYPQSNPKNANMYYIGMSSGKLNSFLSCGVPVVLTNHFPGFFDLKQKCDVGELFENEEQIFNAIKRIEQRYDCIVENIKSFYEQELEFSRKFSPVLMEYMFFDKERC